VVRVLAHAQQRLVTRHFVGDAPIVRRVGLRRRIEAHQRDRGEAHVAMDGAGVRPHRIAHPLELDGGHRSREAARRDDLLKSRHVGARRSDDRSLARHERAVASFEVHVDAHDPQVGASPWSARHRRTVSHTNVSRSESLGAESLKRIAMTSAASANGTASSLTLKVDPQKRKLGSVGTALG
jgi:hypothetical protein